MNMYRIRSQDRITEFLYGHKFNRAIPLTSVTGFDTETGDRDGERERAGCVHRLLPACFSCQRAGKWKLACPVTDTRELIHELQNSPLRDLISTVIADFFFYFYFYYSCLRQKEL